MEERERRNGCKLTADVDIRTKKNFVRETSGPYINNEGPTII